MGWPTRGGLGRYTYLQCRCQSRANLNSSASHVLARPHVCRPMPCPSPREASWAGTRDPLSRAAGLSTITTRAPTHYLGSCSTSEGTIGIDWPASPAAFCHDEQADGRSQSRAEHASVPQQRATKPTACALVDLLGRTEGRARHTHFQPRQHADRDTPPLPRTPTWPAGRRTGRHSPRRADVIARPGHFYATLSAAPFLDAGVLSRPKKRPRGPRRA